MILCSYNLTFFMLFTLIIKHNINFINLVFHKTIIANIYINKYGIHYNITLYSPFHIKCKK